MNREDRRKLAKQMQKEQTDFRMTSLGMKIEREMQAKEKAIAELSRNGITPDDLKKEYERGFDEGYKVAGENVIEMCYAAIVLALRKIHHFGPKRCIDVLQEVDRSILYEISARDMIDRVMDEIGVELCFKDPFNRVQEKE